MLPLLPSSAAIELIPKNLKTQTPKRAPPISVPKGNDARPVAREITESNMVAIPPMPFIKAC